MSGEENVEIVRRQFEAWNRGDDEEWARAYHSDVVVVAPEGWPDGDVSRGLEAWRLQAQRLRDSWAEARAELDEVRPVGDDRVLTRLRYVTKSADTGLPFETPMAVVIVLRDGKITRADYFWKLEDALELAGLPADP